MNAKDFGIMAQVTLDDQSIVFIPSGHDRHGESAAWKLLHTDWQPDKSERAAIATILCSFSKLITTKSKKRQIEVIDGVFHAIGLRRRGES